MVLFVVHFENEDMLFFQGTRVPETSECQAFCDNNRAYIKEHFGYDYHDLGDVVEAGVITRKRASEFWVVEHYEAQDDWPKFMPVVEATISLCNTASVNIWAIEHGTDDRILVGINNDTPKWCELMTNDEGISFFRLGELECLLSDAMRMAS